MSHFKDLADRFKTDIGQFVLRVQTIREVDAEAFLRIDCAAAELARLLVGHSLIPRSLLNELRTAIKVLRAEAPYIDGGRNELAKMADKLEMTFDLILIGESPGDRVPGVPRII